MILSFVGQFAASNPLIYNLIIILFSIILLAKAASYLVLGISNYASKLGVSDYLVGTLVVALASSTPELLSSISGMNQASSSIIFGTLFGSNFVAITFILGLIAIIGKKVPMNEKVFHKTKWDILLLVSIPFILLLDGKLGKIDGVILIMAFIFYVIMLWKREGQKGKIKKSVPLKRIYLDGLLFLLSLFVVLLSAKFLVNSSLCVSDLLGIHPFIISVVLIGLGAQAPDIFLSLHSAKGGHESVALGDLLGSLIIQSLLFFGVFSLMTDLTFPVVNTLVIGFLTIVACLMLFQFVKKKSLTRKDGIMLVILYIIFVATQFFFFS